MSGGSIHFSSGLSGSDPTGPSMYVSETSLEVSNDSQKNGGESD